MALHLLCSSQNNGNQADQTAVPESVSPCPSGNIEILTEARLCISGDISEELPLSRTTVQQHMAELKKMGFIQGEIKGVRTNYCLNPSAFELLKDKPDMFLTDIDCYTSSNC